MDELMKVQKEIMEKYKDLMKLQKLYEKLVEEGYYDDKETD